MTSLVPQLFYDLLGRVVPGAAVVLAFLVVIAGPTDSLRLLRAEQSWIFNFGPVGLFLLVSYLVGFAGGQLWEITLGRVAHRQEAKAEEGFKRTCLLEHNRTQKTLRERELAITSEELPRVFVMHDHLRLVSGVDASRLVKLQAEKRLCQVLVLGLGFLSICNAFILLSRRTADEVVLEGVLIVAVVAYWLRALRFARQFVNGTCVLWLCNASAGRLPFQASREGPEKGMQTGAQKDARA